MFSSKKIKRSQLQDGIVDIRQITNVTLDYTSWVLVSGYYTYTYTNSNIVSTSIVDVIPDNSSVAAIKTASILPNTSSIDGSVTLYSINAPTENILVTINIQNTKQITSATDTSEWTRPIDWLTMPTIGTQEFIGLLAITDDESNHIAISFAGAYTVDWGDGTSQNVASGAQANKSYTYSAISSGTLTTRGYKQVLVRVTPQAGQNLTSLNINLRNPILAKLHSVSWLDVSINGSNFTSIIFANNNQVLLTMCERVVLGSMGTMTSMASFFNYMYALQSVSIPSTSSITSFSSCFLQCYSLKVIPLINTSAALTLDSMFENCYTLKVIPLLNTGASTNFSYMFQGCLSLQTIPLINTGAGINFSFMFANCTTLQSLPNLNTALGTNFSSMIGGNSLAKGAFQGTRYAISYVGKCLSQSAIVDIFNGLGTAVGAQTINVSSNPGRAALTAAEILIATNKGWTIA